MIVDLHERLRFMPNFAAEGGEGSAATSDSGGPPTPSVTEGGGAASPDSGSPQVPAEGGDWMQLGLPLDDDDDVLVVEKEPQTPKEAPPAKPVQAAQPDAKPPAATPEPAKQAAQPAPPPAAEGAAPSLEQLASDPKGLVEQLGRHQQAMVDALAVDRFSLSQQEQEQVTADPAAAMPRLMARAYFEATQSALLHIENFVPKLVVKLMKDLKENEEVEKRFYGNHKVLAKDKHHQDVLQFARTFRAAQPKINESDLFALVGAAVMAKHGLAATGAPQAPPNGAGAPAAFAPARPGASGARVTRTVDDNPYMGLGKDYDDEE